MTEAPEQKSKNLGSALPRFTLCMECQTGILRLQHLTYFTWLNDELITVPNFPAWVCDVCGRRDYDSQAIIRLNTLLSPDTGRSASRKRRFRNIGADQAPTS